MAIAVFVSPEEIIELPVQIPLIGIVKPGNLLVVVLADPLDDVRRLRKIGGELGQPEERFVELQVVRLVGDLAEDAVRRLVELEAVERDREVILRELLVPLVVARLALVDAVERERSVGPLLAIEQALGLRGLLRHLPGLGRRRVVDGLGGSPLRGCRTTTVAGILRSGGGLVELNLLLRVLRRLLLLGLLLGKSVVTQGRARKTERNPPRPTRKPSRQETVYASSMLLACSSFRSGFESGSLNVGIGLGVRMGQRHKAIGSKRSAAGRNIGAPTGKVEVWWSPKNSMMLKGYSVNRRDGTKALSSLSRRTRGR